MNKTKNVETVVGKNCVSCGLCESICPQNCINVVELSYGYFPKVDANKCTNCGICVDSCPIFDIRDRENLSSVKEINVGYAGDVRIVENSSSGGIVSATLRYLLRNKMIDCAIVAKYNKELDIYGDAIYTESEVLEYSGSFYQPSKQLINIKNIALNRDIKSFAFVGLPCHILAFRNFAKNFSINKKFITIGLFCSIGRMKKGMENFLRERFEIDLDKEKIVSYKSRYGMRRPGKIILEFNTRKITVDYGDFLYNYDYFSFPKGCSNCHRLFNISSDISVGDDWAEKTDKKKAIFFANTSLGRNILVELILHREILIERKANISELKASQEIGYPLKFLVNRRFYDFFFVLFSFLSSTTFFRNKYVRKIFIKVRGILLWKIASKNKWIMKK